MNDKPVFSTDKSIATDRAKSTPDSRSKSNAKHNATPMSTGGPCKMRLESNGRGGKQVTVIFNLSFAESDARKHQSSLQSQLGTGGTYKDGMLEFRGDVRTKVEEYFAKLGIRVVRAGG